MCKLNRWLFAYNAITETQIRPKRDQFKWEKIRLINRTRRDYVNILKKKAKNPKLSPADAKIEAVYIFFLNQIKKRL